MNKQAETRIIFDARFRVWRVRFLMFLSLVWCFGFVWLAYESYHRFGLSPGDGGVLRPYGERLGLAIFLVVLATSFPIGMHIYSLCYVTHIEKWANADQFYYHTVRWLGGHRELIEENDLGEQIVHEGKFQMPCIPSMGATPRVNAPYRSQKSKRRRLPYIIDDQGWSS